MNVLLYDRQPRMLSEIILTSVIIFITKRKKLSEREPSDSPSDFVPPKVDSLATALTQGICYMHRVGYTRHMLHA